MGRHGLTPIPRALASPTSGFSWLCHPARLPAPLRFSHGVAPTAARAGFPRVEFFLGLDLSLRFHSASHQLPSADFDRRFPVSFPFTSAATITGALTSTITVTITATATATATAIVAAAAGIANLRGAVRSNRHDPALRRDAALADS